MTQHADSRAELIAIIQRRAPPVADEAGDARRGAGRGLRRGGAGAVGVRAAVDAVHAGVDPRLPHRDRAGRRALIGYVFLVAAAAAAASPTSRSRCISKSTSRRSRRRSSARSRRAGQRRRRRSRRRSSASWSRTRSRRCRPIEDGRRVEREPVRRYSGAARRRARDRRRRLRARSGLPAARAVGAAGHLAERRGRGAVPHRGHAGQRHRAARRRSDDHRASSHGFESDQAVLMVRKSPTGRVRAGAARPRRRASTRGCCSTSRRRSSTSSRRVGVRSPVYTLKVVDVPYVQKLELEYHFPAYTGLAAAQDRRRRRHRRAARHRGPRPRRPDDGGRGRRDRRRRQDAGAADACRPTAR